MTFTTTEVLAICFMSIIFTSHITLSMINRRGDVEYGDLPIKILFSLLAQYSKERHECKEIEIAFSSSTMIKEVFIYLDDQQKWIKVSIASILYCRNLGFKALIAQSNRVSKKEVPDRFSKDNKMNFVYIASVKD